jgi:hypothetical protein
MVPKSYKNGRVVCSHEVTVNFPKNVHELLRFLNDRQILMSGFRFSETFRRNRPTLRLETPYPIFLTDSIINTPKTVNYKMEENVDGK